jgi:hypothetical protein
MSFMAFLEKKMQVSEMMRILSTYDSDAHIAIKWYDKEEFEMDLDEGMTDLAWQAVCEEFEQNEGIEQANCDFLSQHSYDHRSEGGYKTCDCGCDD